MPVQITQETLSTEPTLSRAEAADLLGMKINYLAALGSRGYGPKCFRDMNARGRPTFYSPRDLREWCEESAPDRLAAFDERLAAMNAEG